MRSCDPNSPSLLCCDCLTADAGHPALGRHDRDVHAVDVAGLPLEVVVEPAAPAAHLGRDEQDLATRGAVGSDDPLQAIGDALAVFRAGEVLLVAPEMSRRRWLDYDLERQARDVYGVHVSVVTTEGGVAGVRGEAVAAEQGG